MRLLTKEDCFNGPIYTEYRHHEGYRRRAELFRNFPEPILIAGCGFGFLVSEFLSLGKSVWGIDASEYAIENRENTQVWQGNILDSVDVSLLQAQIGTFGTVITEDMLPCLTDQEAISAARNCATLGKVVIHLVTEQGEADLNYHSCSYWMTLTKQLTVSLEGF